MDKGKAKEDSSGEMFVRRVSSSGVVLKFKVDNHPTLPCDPLWSKEPSLDDAEGGSDTSENASVNNAQNTRSMVATSKMGNNAPVENAVTAIPSLEKPDIGNNDAVSSAENTISLLEKSESEIGHNTAARDAENATPLLEINSMTGDNDPENGIPLLKNSSSEGAEKGIAGDTESEVNSIAMEADGISTSLENVVMDNTVTRMNEMCLSHNPKEDTAEGVIIGVGSEANAEAGGVGEIEAQVCQHCDESFPTMDELEEHMASHKRKRYRSLRMKPEPPMSPPKSPVVTEQDECKEIWDASFSLVNMSMASEWEHENVVDAIDVTSSNAEKGSEDMEQIWEIADVMMTLSRPFICSTCLKSFPTYQALGGHRSSHNKVRQIRHDDDTGSSNGGGPWKHVCNKCGDRFLTGQALGGHKRRHRLEQCKLMQQLTEANLQPPAAPLADVIMEPIAVVGDSMPSPSLELLPADDTVLGLPLPPTDQEALQPPPQQAPLADVNMELCIAVAGVSDTMLIPAEDTVNLPVPPTDEAPQPPQDLNRLDDQAEQMPEPSGMQVDAAAQEVPAPMMIPDIVDARDRGFDLNEVPSEDMEEP